MKILYVTNSRLPTEKAHGLQIMNMVEAFRIAGIELELILPKRDNPIKQDIFVYYQKKSGVTQKLWCWDLISRAPKLGALAFWIESITFAWSVKKYTAKNPGDVIYTRDLLSLLFLPKKNKIIYEAHSLPKKIGWFYKILLKKVSKIITITLGLKKDLTRLGFPANKILVAPDAVDLKLFKENSQTVCRTKLDWPSDKKIALYSGHLYAWKGVDTVLDAAEKLSDVLFVFVGGTEKDAREFVKKIEHKKLVNVWVLGHVPQAKVPDYLGAADWLLLPNSAHEKISAQYTSPLKLFEYMASNRPIVASDLPSIREIISDQTASFFTPDNADSLAKTIKGVWQNKSLAQAKATRAKNMVIDYTWDKRVEKILKYL